MLPLARTPSLARTSRVAADRLARTAADSRGLASLAAVPRAGAQRRDFRAGLAALLLLVAMVPVLHVADQAVAASRNIVFWDEFDTVLDFILRLHRGGDIADILRSFFAINNEHRMFTSRLIFALSYWTTGTVNFHFVGAVGNSFIVGACALLVYAAVSWPRRLCLVVLLSLLVFQLENFENFLWSGASIDHFQVVMHGVAALVAVSHGARVAVLAGGLFALLATFTLAQGCIIWPIGAFMLWRTRRWKALAGWLGLAGCVLLAFFADYSLNPAHRLAAFSLAGAGRVGAYWLSLLGGPLALGSVAVAPWLGASLLGVLGVLGVTGGARREPVFFPIALFAVAALGLVAIGRVEVAGGQLLSRYMILGTLAWALVIFMVMGRGGHPARWWPWWVPACVAFNVAANLQYAPLAEGYAEARDRAASRFLQYGDDTHGAVRLHPRAGHARAVLKLAAEHGVYTLPSLSEPREFSAMAASTRILAHLDETTVSAASVYLGGWAMIPGLQSRRGQIHIVLRSSARQLIFSTVPIQRPDVAGAYQEPRWRLSGFRFALERDDLPAEDFQIGVLVDVEPVAEYVMTEQWLRLSDPAFVPPWISNDS